VQARSGPSAALLAAPVLNNNAPVLTSGSTVTLAWTSSAGAVSYIIEVASMPGAPPNLAAYNTGNLSTTIVVPGVPDGTYYLRVRAADATGGLSATSNEVQVVVATCPSAPGALHVMSLIGGNLTLGWQPPASGPPLSYVIQAGSAPGRADLAAGAAERTATTATASLAVGTYYVRVYGVGTSCPAPSFLGPPSNEIVVTVGSDGPRPYRLTLHVPYTYYCQPTTTDGFDYLYDGNLDVHANALTFTLPESQFEYWHFLTLRLTVAGDRASGSIVNDGSIAIVRGSRLWTWISGDLTLHWPDRPAQPAATSGTAAADGRVEGAFDGFVYSDILTIPQTHCTGHFPWSLAPR
jgi:hypothetical protein